MKEKNKEGKGKFFIVSFLGLLILWLPSFLALYPGLYTYDASWQHDMYCMGEVTEHHPVWHTYLLGWCTHLFENADGMNKGVFLYTSIQMLLMGLGCAYILYLLKRRNEPKWMRVFALSFFGLFPTFVIFVFTDTKDSLFAVAVAAFLLLNLELFEDKKKFFENVGNMGMWGLLLFFVCTLRNNAVYPLVIVLPFFIVSLIKSNCNKKKAFLMLSISIVVLLIYKFPITKAITVDGISDAEKLSVPCQQVMRVYTYHKEELTSDEIDFIEEAFDKDKWGMIYVPEIADATKGSLRLELFKENKTEFIKFWWKLFKKYPGEYINSFLDNTNAFWNPWPHYVIYSFGGEGYTPIESMGPAVLNPKIKWLFNIYKNFENGDIVQKDYWISWIFSPAFYFYVFMGVFILLLVKKDKRFLIPFIFVLLLWLTFLLGPVAMVRYALYLYALVPVWPAYVKAIKKNSLTNAHGEEI